MPEPLTWESFAKHLDQSFRLHAGAGILEFVLIEAEALKAAGGQEQRQAFASRRQPFSLVFQGPKEPVLQQQIYRMEHGEMGRLELFLVPIGQTESATHYQAIFN